MRIVFTQKSYCNSAGRSPDLYNLIGRRIVIAAETDEGARFSAAEVKRLTGGDCLVKALLANRLATLREVA